MSASSSDNAVSQSGVYGANNFTLSAYTRVTFSAAASVSGSAQGGSVNYEASSDYAAASINFIVSGAGPYGNGSQSEEDSFSQVIYGYAGDPVIYTFSQSQTVGASFSNLTAGNLAGFFDANVSTTALSYATAVPEPESYAMLLVGFGLIGAITRRKQKNS